MVSFSGKIEKFGKNGDKPGWTYLIIPQKKAEKLNPSNKKSFRIKGKLDETAIKHVALIPFGNGDYILPINATMRKSIKKIKGDSITVTIEMDTDLPEINEELLFCLRDEPKAFDFFNTLTPGHKKYFSNWVNTAKTEQTKAKRIAHCVNALAKKWDYGLMIRTLIEENKILKLG